MSQTGTNEINAIVVDGTPDKPNTDITSTITTPAVATTTVVKTKTIEGPKDCDAESAIKKQDELIKKFNENMD